MANNRYHNILFDWDGCLANTLPVWLEGYKRAFAAYKIFPSDDEIVEKAFGNWRSGLLFSLFTLEDVEGFNTILLSYVNEKLRDVPLHQNVLPMMKALKQKKKQIAIVTTSVKEFITPVLERNKISEYINTIIDGNVVAKCKPDPESIYKALEELGGIKEEAIIVGDSAKDIKAGKNAGVATAVYYPPANHVLYTQGFIDSLGADYMVTDFVELQKMF